MLAEAGKITFNCIFDIAERFLSGLPLGNASGQSWTFSNKYAVLVHFDDNTVNHLFTIRWHAAWVKPHIP